jgi:hypothetical protein
MALYGAFQLFGPMVEKWYTRRGATKTYDG